MNLEFSRAVDAAPGNGATRPGRTPATTRSELSRIALELFLEHGFDETTVDDIVREAGIGRRTFFRYFPTKNDLPWGDFEGLLDRMRADLDATDETVPVIEALRQAVVKFNDFPDEELPYHRGRMSLLLTVPSLTAYSTLRYAAWRDVIAQYVARRRGEETGALAPQTIAWACLGLCIGSYERWLADDETDLLELLDQAFLTAETVFGLSES